MKKLLIALATTVALVGPAKAGEYLTNGNYISCSPRDGIESRIFKSSKFKDLHPWSGQAGLSWGFISKRTLDEIHFQGDLYTPRGFLFAHNVWIIATEWDCDIFHEGD
jgi:hypothetical protein